MECEPGPGPGARAAIALLQPRHALAVVHALRDGPLRFGELQRATRAASATTLHARLRELRAADVVTHEAGSYRLTPRGAALRGAFDAIDRFTDAHPAHDPTVILTALQRRTAMAVMRELRQGELGFNDLHRATGAASATTLARRLDDLEGLGLIVRTTRSTMPPRTTYRHSDVGADFSPVVGHIVAWGEATLSAP